MNEYRMVYKCSDGYEGEEIIPAVNMVMAFEIFEELGIEDVVSVDCFRILEDDDIYNECRESEGYI